MDLTPAQITSLRAACFADATAATFFPPRDNVGLCDYLNGASPFIVWRTSVTQDEIMQNGFDWTRVDNMTVGKARIWEWMFDNDMHCINPAKLNVRAGIDASWTGTGADLAVRAAVYVHCKRAATRAERMLANGTGTDAVPGLMVAEGEIFQYQVDQLMFKSDGSTWTAGG